MQELEILKYPIGKYEPPKTITETQLKEWIEQLEILPQEIADVSAGLSKEQLEIQYRPNGWTVRQVIHHLADSHINAYTRVRLTLTEDRPTVRPYDEVAWAELTDGKVGNIRLSIAILKAIHERLVTLLKTLKFADFDRTYYHPAAQQEFTLAYLVGNYAWHGKHHLAHIKSTLK
ncbi:MAG: putative metal-dependent hydrolase [Pedobacter sp.]|nr:MAG: putative metal-dependent hydrolase [Pedobacter sp.]